MAKWSGGSIRRLRKLMGLRQVDFAKEIGVTPVYVSFLEGGQKEPGPTLQLLLNCIANRELASKGKRRPSGA